MGNLLLKRGFDFVFSLLGLLFVAPLFVLVSIIIKIGSPGPVFFRQTRVGRKGKLFKIWKFRTMYQDSRGVEITVAGDKRITKIGKFLRRYKIDELPQLINVLLGEMSFVGPRPEVPKYVNLYTDNQKKVLDVRPGITGPASLKYRNENELLSEQEDPEEFYIKTIMPDKIKISLDYQEKENLWTDCKLIIQTIL